jgi:hypothetical protein
LGGKILWKLYTNRRHPVSQIPRKKYLKGASLRKLQAKNTPKGMLIWNLCRRGLDFFQKHLYRIPGNGAKTMLWQDSIMGKAPLDVSEEFKEICEWLTQHGFTKLTDISSWDTLESWQTWVFLGTPDHLQTQKYHLQAVLTGLALVHLHLSDKWGWGKFGFYITSQGFTSLQSPQVPIESTSLWKQVWDPLRLPKIKLF